MRSRFARQRSGLWLPKDKPPFGARLTAGHPLARGIIGCWLFNEGGGANAFDICDNPHHGQLSSCNWAGGGIQFAAGYGVDLGQTWLSGLSEFSVLVWATPSAVSGEYAFIGCWDSAYQFLLEINSGALLAALVSEGAYIIAQGGSIPANQPVFAAMTYNGNDSPVLRGYLDGVEVVNHQGKYSLDPVTGPIYIGQSGADTKLYSGEIQAVLIYDRVLSASELAGLCADPYCMFEMPGPVRVFNVSASGGAKVSISCGSLSFSLGKTHVNEAPAVGNAVFSAVGQALHVNEAVPVGKSAISLAGKSLTPIGETIVSIGAAVAGFAGHALTCFEGLLRAARRIYLNVQSAWTGKPKSRGY